MHNLLFSKLTKLLKIFLKKEKIVIKELQIVVITLCNIGFFFLLLFMLVFKQWTDAKGGSDELEILWHHKEPTILLWWKYQSTFWIWWWQVHHQICSFDCTLGKHTISIVVMAIYFYILSFQSCNALGKFVCLWHSFYFHSFSVPKVLIFKLLLLLIFTCLNFYLIFNDSF